jgi:hypothetical protein
MIYGVNQPKFRSFMNAEAEFHYNYPSFASNQWRDVVRVFYKELLLEMRCGDTIDIEWIGRFLLPFCGPIVAIDHAPLYMRIDTHCIIVCYCRENLAAAMLRLSTLSRADGCFDYKTIWGHRCCLKQIYWIPHTA